DPRFIGLLEQAITGDEFVEKLLTRIRRYFLDQLINNHSIPSSSLRLLCALSIQCFFNEYIYEVSEEEENKIQLIKRDLQPKTIQKEAIAILGCYEPLYQIPEMHVLANLTDEKDPSFSKFVTIQLQEPLLEKKLATEIPQISKIQDQV